MVTLSGLRRRLENLVTKDDQIFIFHQQTDGSVIVTQPGNPDVNERHFPGTAAACEALGLPEGGPAITIQRGYGL